MTHKICHIQNKVYQADEIWKYIAHKIWKYGITKIVQCNWHMLSIKYITYNIDIWNIHI